VTRLRAGRRGSFPGRGNEGIFFLFATESILALRPTQPPIQWIPEAFFLVVKRPWLEADHSRSSSTDSTYPYALMVWCLVKHRKNFTFFLPCHVRLPGVDLRVYVRGCDLMFQFSGFDCASALPTTLHMSPLRTVAESLPS
jgi:hypothetical protein